MNTETYELTLADQEEAAAVARERGTSGRHPYLRALAKHPLAKDEFWATKKWKTHDHIHLTQYDGSDIVVWMGRAANGYHYPVSRYMRLVPVAGDPTHD